MAQTAQNLFEKLLQKIRFQWKTLRKAFCDLNQDKSGSIDKQELRFIMNHWGYTVPDRDFNELFEHLDADGDGVLNYADFVKRVGSELHPSEALYFRQE
jgi:Ca2+-binding EF-hand superfamily protein